MTGGGQRGTSHWRNRGPLAGQGHQAKGPTWRYLVRVQRTWMQKRRTLGSLGSVSVLLWGWNLHLLHINMG